MPVKKLIAFLLFSLTSTTWAGQNGGLRGFFLSTCNQSGSGTCLTIRSSQAYELPVSMEFNLRNPIIKIFKNRYEKIPQTVLKGPSALLSMTRLEVLLRKWSSSNDETLVQIESNTLTDL